MNETEHLLTKLIEECTEVIKACTKALTFGLDDTWDPNSNLPKWDLTPRQEIRHELNDIDGVVMLLGAKGVLPLQKTEKDNEEVVAKVSKVLRLMQYAQKQGALE